jgi:hypothetical protein
MNALLLMMNSIVWRMNIPIAQICFFRHSPRRKVFRGYRIQIRQKKGVRNVHILTFLFFNIPVENTNFVLDGTHFSSEPAQTPGSPALPCRVLWHKRVAPDTIRYPAHYQLFQSRISIVRLLDPGSGNLQAIHIRSYAPRASILIIFFSWF